MRLHWNQWDAESCHYDSLYWWYPNISLGGISLVFNQPQQVTKLNQKNNNYGKGYAWGYSKEFITVKIWLKINHFHKESTTFICKMHWVKTKGCRVWWLVLWLVSTGQDKNSTAQASRKSTHRHHEMTELEKVKCDSIAFVLELCLWCDSPLTLSIWYKAKI